MGSPNVERHETVPLRVLTRRRKGRSQEGHQRIALDSIRREITGGSRTCQVVTRSQLPAICGKACLTSGPECVTLPRKTRHGRCVTADASSLGREGTGATMTNASADERRSRKERLARDLEEALANTPPTHDELAARPLKRGPRIQGLTAREFGQRVGVQYQTVLVWLREYDPEFPAEHNWPKLADVMGLTLDEFRSRYLFSQPVPARPTDQDRFAELEQRVDQLRAQIADLQALIEGRGETG